MVISSRVHAGETNASFIMRHFIKELTSGNQKYEALLNNYIIKLIPMINVDGVVVGNARSCLVGLDLNRRWTEPNPLIHPEIYFLKKLMQRL
jgi:murein tripeptide amidase MpaA